MASAFVRGELLCAWKGTSLLITSPAGACDGQPPLAGYYYREARHLQTLRLSVNGRSPWLCEAAAPDPHTLAFCYVYPEITEPGGGGTGQAGDEEHVDAEGVPERALDIRLTYTVDVASVQVSVVVTNRARTAVTFDVACTMEADFADIQEPQSKRRQSAAVDVAASGDSLRFCYRHPQLPLSTEVSCAGWQPQGSRVSTRLTLEPREERTLLLRVRPLVGGEWMGEEAVEARRFAADGWQAGMTRVLAPGATAHGRVIASNIRDFASFPLLDGQPDEWLAPQAGFPAYPALFGRDAITAGWQAAMLDRGALLGASLTRLARLQSARIDDWRDEQPGRLPYQVRTGPLAQLNVNPYAGYYADFATPLMFVVGLANLYAWTGDRRDIRRFWDAARRVLDWARDFGDPDGDGYLEYLTRSSEGTKNQGWKDSGDAIIYDDGTPVPAPIATCELQGYWHAAQELMSLLALAMGADADAAAYRESAAALKTRFNRDWWSEDEQFIALALDPDKRRVDAVTSNVGHCIASGIVDAARLPAVVGRLFAPDMFSGWGIRTLSSAHRFYNPLSYHRGTVWAVEQGTIVFGLRRFGFDARALDLAGATFDLALLYPESRIPECVGGYARGERPTPAAYPRANTPQLWNATAFPLIVQSLLGLLPVAPADTLVVDPVLPTWLPEVTVHGLRVGGATVALRFRREESGASTFEVLHKRGTLHVVRQPPPESLSASIVDRLGGLLQTLTGG